jgi:hypothetical protein
LISGQSSVLFRTLDARKPTAQWQAEILRAFQAWTVDARIDFGVMPDGGQPFGAPGADQNDPRFGDVRIGALPLTPEVLSIAVPHDPVLAGTWSGDILLNSAVAFDQTADLVPVLLHEVGHVLGLPPSADPSSVMFETLNNQRTLLAPGDIAAVQTLYGARGQDPYEGPGPTGTIQATAAPPGTDDFALMSADPTAGKTTPVGSSDRDVAFGQVAANPTVFVASSVDGVLSQRSFSLAVTETQLFDWLLAAPAVAATPSGVVRMELVNSAGLVVATGSVTPGDNVGGDPVLLSPGIYQARFTAASTGNAPLPLLAFQLYGASLSDPIGPAFDDPTLDPLAPRAPVPLAAALALPAVPGSSDNPYYWLALGLNGRDVPGLIEGQDPVPSAGATPLTTLAAPGTAEPPGHRVSAGNPANDRNAPSPALAGLRVSTDTGAPRVVVTDTLNHALLLASLITMGAATPVNPAGPSGAFPEPRQGTDGAQVARIAPGPPPGAAGVEPPEPPVPGCLVRDLPASFPGLLPGTPGSPDESYKGDEGGSIGCGAAAILTILWITAILYCDTHRRQTHTREQDAPPQSRSIS